MGMSGEFGVDVVVHIGSRCTLTHYIKERDAGPPES